LVEIAGDSLFFQAISRTGRVVDQGALARRNTGQPIPAPRP
jgi:hypothetical protein